MANTSDNDDSSIGRKYRTFANRLPNTKPHLLAYISLAKN